MTVSVEPFECRLDPPLKTARETMETRTGLLVRIENQVEGIGDSAPLPPFTESYDESKRALERANDAYRKSAWHGALRVVSETDRGRLRFPAARHAVSLALLDWRGKQKGKPLQTVLGGSTGESVPVNATVGDGPPAKTVRAALQAKKAGFPAIKLKVGARSVPEDLKRLKAVRDRLGPGIELRADANGAWDLEEATEFLTGVDDFRLAVLEQPLPADRIQAHAELQGLGPDIFLDESLARADIESVLVADVADGYVLKPMALGGVDRAMGVAFQAGAQGAKTVVSSIFESCVGRTGAIHLAAALDSSMPAGLGTADRFVTDLGPDPAPVRNGSIVPPTGPGLGIEEVRTDG